MEKILRVVGVFLNHFDSFIYDWSKKEYKNKEYYPSIFFVYWDKKCQILELEVLGKVTYYYVGR